MKFKLAAAALLASTAMASAADLAARPYAKAPVAAPVYNWTGFYIGGQLGASSAQTRFQDRDDYFDNEGMNPERKIGFTGGVYGGYNWQVSPSFLFGIDAQWSWYDQKLTGYPDYSDSYLRTDIRDAGNVKARLGLVFNDTMVYVAAGPAWANTRFNAVRYTEPVFSSSKYVGGYAAAVGVEHMITQNWIMKGQFQYAAFNTQHAEHVVQDGGFRNRFGQTTDLIEATIGLSYKFGPTY